MLTGEITAREDSCFVGSSYFKWYVNETSPVEYVFVSASSSLILLDKS